MSKGNETDIEWLKQSFRNMRKEMNTGFQSINDKLDMYEQRFETKEHAREERERIEEEVEQKAEKEDLERVEKFQRKVIWLVISTVVTAILATFIVNPF